MKKLSAALLITSALTLAACGQAGEQWLNPDTTFALFDQPTVKGVSDTQEDMAKEALKLGDYGRAMQFYRQLVDGKKGTPEQVLRYKMGLAECTRRLGDDASALAMFEELYRENPNNLEVMEGRGLSLMASGKTVDAGRAFSDIVERDPKRWRSLNALGILFVTKNMIPEAMAYYTEALNQSPDNAAILNNVGLSQAADRNFPRAIKALEQALRVSKNPLQKKQIDLNLAMVHGVSGDFETAREIAGKYLEGPGLENNLGLYAHLAKDDALAKSYLNMALSQSPSYYERAWENLAVVNESGRDGGNASGGSKGLPKFAPEKPVAEMPAAKKPEPEKTPAAKPEKKEAVKPETKKVMAEKPAPKTPMTAEEKADAALDAQALEFSKELKESAEKQEATEIKKNSEKH